MTSVVQHFSVLSVCLFGQSQSITPTKLQLQHSQLWKQAVCRVVGPLTNFSYSMVTVGKLWCSVIPFCCETESLLLLIKNIFFEKLKKKNHISLRSSAWSPWAPHENPLLSFSNSLFKYNIDTYWNNFSRKLKLFYRGLHFLESTLVGLKVCMSICKRFNICLLGCRTCNLFFSSEWGEWKKITR